MNLSDGPATNTARGNDLLASARRFVESGRPVAGRAMVDAARACGADADALDELDGRLLLDEGHVERAIQVASGALQRRGENWRLRCLRAEARLAAQDPAGSAADAAEALIAAASEPAPKAALGAALLVLGDVPGARACLAEAVGGNPTHVGYRLTLSRSLVAAGDLDEAARVLERGIVLQPRASPLWVNAARLAVSVRDYGHAVSLADRARGNGVLDARLLGLQGHALSCLGRDQDAANSYHEALQLVPEDGYVRHLAAASGRVAAPSRACPDYVRVLFDGFASRFDVDLIQLDYRAPGLVRNAVLAHVPGAARGLDEQDTRSAHADPIRQCGPVVDLGCGTGLMALVLSDLPLGPMVGIDLSSGMLAEAAAKNLYDRLIEGDILCELLPAGPFRLALATDVLPYLGDPEPFFIAVRQRLAPGGHLILTAETLDEPTTAGFRLGRHGRFAHRQDVLCHAAQKAGFTLRSQDTGMLRRDRDGPVEGCVLVLQVAAATAPSTGTWQ